MAIEVLTGLPPEIEQYRQLIKSRLRWHTRFVHGYSMPWHQQIWVEALEDQSIKRLLIIAPPKYGKALALDTPIPVPSGWKTMGELKVGDSVFAGNGSVTTVIGMSPILKDRRVFRVADRLGHHVIADADHEWIVRLDRKYPTSFRKCKTEWLYRRQNGLAGNRAFYIKVQSGLKLPDALLPIPPYTLGVWLGDGDSDGGRFTCGDDDRHFISAEIQKDGFFITEQPCKTRCGRAGIRGLSALLRQNNLLGNKHIPQEYMRASQAQRLALLQGLMDTDGHVAEDGDGGEFCNMKEELARQVSELVLSLGLKCSLSIGMATVNGKDCGTKYRVLLRGEGIFRLPRKLSRCHKSAKDGHYITIKAAGVMDTKCIAVEHESHTFLAGEGMFPTCNTPVVGLDYLGWRIGNDPEGYHCIYVSNTATQANKNSVALRDMVAYNKNYRFLYGIEPDVNKGWGENEWYVKRKNESDKDPTLQATGVNGPILGATVQEVIYDDIADQENMATEYQRQKLMEWVKTTPSSRLVPGGREIMICTRWHEEDPAAIFEKEGWVVIRLPAIDEDGNPTYPEYWSVDDLIGDKPSSAKSTLGTKQYELMFQQNVLPEGGNIFKHEWWRYWEQGKAPWQLDSSSESHLPIRGIVQSWDTAFKEKQANDFSVCETWNILDNGYYLVDVWRGKVDFPKLKLVAVANWEQSHPMAVLIEDAASGQCYSSDTEILTKRGWRLFSDTDVDIDVFATRNVKTGYFEWQRATSSMKEEYVGRMLHFHGRSVDLLVTPDHRMLVNALPRKLGGNRYRSGDAIVKARDLVEYQMGSRIGIPMTSSWEGVEIESKEFHADKEKMSQRYGGRFDTIGRRIGARELNPVRMSGDDYCAFMGAYLSEGWFRINHKCRTYDVFVSQRKQGTIAFDKFAELLSRIQGRQISYNGHDFVICSLGLAEFVSQFGKAGDKYVPGDIMNASSRQLRIFWEYYALGDGDAVGGITTISPRIEGQLVEIAQKIGYSASTYKKKRPLHSVLIGNNNRPTPPENFKQAYRIGLRKSKAMGFHVEDTSYDGTIYCVSVPNGVVYVRRNGKPAWCGQSLIQELRTHTRIPVIPIKVDKDKVSRANAVTPTLEAGKVFIPKEASWRPQWEHEHEIFPSGVNDDQVDTTTQFLNWARQHVVTGTAGLTGVGKQSTWRQQ